MTDPPKAKNRKTHLAALVEIGVEPCAPPPCRHQSHLWGHVWVLVREAKHEIEETAFIRGVEGPTYQSVDHSDVRLIHMHKDTRQRVRKERPEVAFDAFDAPATVRLT
eukprot:CAMPEP_0173400344 /NCGR_PEP_ID=MMETSP1356-20130122/47672_1 /TAXON_ID=77927 ORGANISM="Hemiselmis virescens, Strain PCC157" /NCGR_SAMPLE_ID=MMETSP1356 /ASSEMBLY_ACC=CAM_ASM_000847 /LENGTH=107 /DNA_ID=CAMNT_0014360253 /DNA_START=292 /DNA_END=613 /DNA_ORIENTATION=+